MVSAAEPAPWKADRMRRSVLVPLLETVLTLLGLAWLAAVLVFGSSAVPLLVVWNLAAVAYVIAGWFLLRRRIPAGEDDADLMAAPRWQTTLFAVVVSGSGLVGGLLMIATRGDEPDPALQPVAAATVLLSWLLLHTAFAQIYARDYFTAGGLHFPDCERPQLTEFVYFSITIGTSFAVSDVTVTRRSTRRLVIVHSVLSFFFNAAVVAIALDWIKSGG